MLQQGNRWQQTTWVPGALQTSHSMTYTCAGLCMCMSKTRNSDHSSIFAHSIAWCSSHGSSSPLWWVWKLHHAMVVFLGKSDQKALWFQMWLGFQMRYQLWELGKYTLQLEIRMYLLWLLFQFFLLKEVADFSRHLCNGQCKFCYFNLSLFFLF